MDKYFYFVVKDGCCDPETGETDDAGMKVFVEGLDEQEEVVAFVEKQMPHFAGRLRSISEEEYIREFGDEP